MLITYIIIGFFAQLIDGSLGMAYGVSCRTFLNIFGKVPSNIISAIIHYAEIPTSFVSMISHIKFKNINKTLFCNLVIPGILGGIIGSYVITLNLGWIELGIDIYLMIMGVIILKKSILSISKNKLVNNKIYIRILGFIGAIFDVSGGGGWGPIVTGSLLIDADNPKEIIGTVNSSEFLISLFSSISFLLLITNIKEYFIVVIGLLIGGVIAAPISVRLCQKIANEKLYIIVGVLMIVLNGYNILCRLI